MKAILKVVEKCAKKVGGPYAKDSGGAANINVCGLKNAVFFNADLDIDCDGKETAVCNRQTDPWFQNQTAAVDSTGKPLDSSKLPFLVVPGVSSKWSYRNAGIQMGSVGLAIYKDKIEFGVVGDVGPKAIIGEASYAMAKNLGINPHPSTGGTASGVTYILFTGAGAVIRPIENHDKAVELGKAKVKELLEQNAPPPAPAAAAAAAAAD